MKSSGLFLFVSGWLTCAGATSEIALERMERKIYEAPASVSNELYHFRLKLGGKEAVETRWKKYFDEAGGEEKERWALLLAMNASPPFRTPEIDRSKRWMQSAGSSVEAHSFRAALSAMENDADSVLEHLEAATRLEPGVQLFRQKWQTIAVRDRLKSGGEAELNFWLEQWQVWSDSPFIRLWIGKHLTDLHAGLNRLREWVGDLEETFAESPDSKWVEAAILSLASRMQFRADLENLWIAKTRAAGAPDIVQLIVEGRFLSNPSNIFYLYDTLGFDHYPPSDSFAAAGFVSLVSALQASPKKGSKERLAKFIERNADLLLQDPLALMSLLSSGGAVHPAVLRILKKHCAQKPDDLEAWFVYGRLLLFTEDGKSEGAQVMEAFLKRAEGKLEQRVISTSELSSRSKGGVFVLRFPPLKHAREKDPEPADFVRSTFAFPNESHFGEPKSFPAYENWKYFDSNGGHSTVGDLFLAGMFHLKKADTGRFEPIYRQWLREMNPPLSVRLAFAMRVDLQRHYTELTSKVVQTVIDSDTAREEDLIEVMVARGKWLAKPEQILKAGELLVAMNPANKRGADMSYLWALVEWERVEEAKAMFAKVREQADLTNEEDQRALWSFSRRLAQVAKDESLELPLPDFLRKQNEARPDGKDEGIKQLIAYFNGASLPRFEFNKAERLFVFGDTLGAGKSGDVMFQWGMELIDPALSIYEHGFAMRQWRSPGVEVFTSGEMKRLVAEVDEDSRSFAAVRAFYEGDPTPEEQLKRIEAVAARFPDDQRLRLTVAAKAMTLEHYQKAIDVAKSAVVELGDDEWIKQAILLLSGVELGDNETAHDAARELAKITWRKESREWLAGKMELLGLWSKAEKMRVVPEFVLK